MSRMLVMLGGPVQFSTSEIAGVLALLALLGIVVALPATVPLVAAARWAAATRRTRRGDPHRWGIPTIGCAWLGATIVFWIVWSQLSTINGRLGPTTYLVAWVATGALVRLAGRAARDASPQS